MKNKKLKIAVVGCGYIANAHIGGLQRLHEAGCRELEVSACCDLLRENAQSCSDKIAAFQGKAPAVITSIDELIKSSCAEAAIVCLPHCFHHTASVQLMEAGLDVLLEKPVGITIKASRIIIDAAKKHKRVLATAEQVRRTLGARACRWALCEAELIGKPRFADIQFIYNGPIQVDKPMFKWRALKLLTGGGMIMDSGAHFSDMMLHMFGEPDTVSCEMHTHKKMEVKNAPLIGDAPVDVEDTFHVVINFKNGVRVNWNYSNVQPGKEQKSGFYYGESGIMQDIAFALHCFQGGGELIQADGTRRSSEWIEREYLFQLDSSERERLFPYGIKEGIALEIADFVRAVKEGTAPEIDGEGGLRAKALSMAMYESSTLGNPLKYQDVLSGKICAYQDPIDKFWKIF